MSREFQNEDQETKSFAELVTLRRPNNSQIKKRPNTYSNTNQKVRQNQ